MANPGFNIKVRVVENGVTIHATSVHGAGNETHKDYVAADMQSVLDIINKFANERLDELLEPAKEL
jgi:hypothetical protein